ncbi:MAG: hypothetical protein HY747_11850 [Elusimicrobia bacterium]|nr:hypothetical protein [Elusimicrobiota bacterium]
MSLAKKRQQLIDSLPLMSEIIRGSLLREYHKNCPCHPKGRYGPYWRLSVNQGGKTRMRQLRDDHLPQVRQALKNYRRWWETCLRIIEINTEIMISKEA